MNAQKYRIEGNRIVSDRGAVCEMLAGYDQTRCEDAKRIIDALNVLNDESDAECSRRGANVAALLGLKPTREHRDRFDTAWGNKTAMGLYRTLLRVMSGEEVR